VSKSPALALHQSSCRWS